MLSMAEFFRVVFRDLPNNATLGLTAISKSGKVYNRFFNAKALETFEAAVTAELAHNNVYFRVTPLKKVPEVGRGEESLALGSNVLFADYDTEPVETIEKLQNLGTPPTIIVSTGTGIHAYWLLEDFATDLSAIKLRNKTLTRVIDFEGDSCYDLARVLRVPQTYNLKYDPPRECRVVFFDSTRVYKLTDFEPSNAEIDDSEPVIWEAAQLGPLFFDEIRDKDKKLSGRISDETQAYKYDAPRNAQGSIDHSRNDAYICTRLYGLGYTPDVALAVLTHPHWLSGAKYRDKKRYNYAVMTANKAWQRHLRSADRWFVKNALKADQLAEHVSERVPFVTIAGQLYRYEKGVYLADGEEWLRQYLVSALGARWSNKAATEVVQWVRDKNYTQAQTVNSHDGLVNVQNGMLDYLAGKLKPHSQKYVSLAQLPIRYDAGADPSQVSKFIGQVLPSDAIAMFWEYVGSCLITTKYWPKAFLLFVGPKNAGKSKVMELLRLFFGERNVNSSSLATLADSRFARASLVGKYANIYPDLENVETQNAGLIKALTGDDYITADRKHTSEITFKSTARLFFSSNHFPMVRESDDAFFSRVFPVMCKNTFEGAKADPQIVDKLSTPENLSAMLNLALEGLQRLLKAKQFTLAASVITAQTEYRMTADSVGAFFESYCEPSNVATPKQQIYAAYSQACKAGNRRPVSDVVFFRRCAENLSRYGIEERYVAVGGKRVWCFIGKRPTDFVVTSFSESLYTEN